MTGTITIVDETNPASITVTFSVVDNTTTNTLVDGVVNLPGANLNVEGILAAAIGYLTALKNNPSTPVNLQDAVGQTVTV